MLITVFTNGNDSEDSLDYEVGCQCNSQQGRSLRSDLVVQRVRWGQGYRWIRLCQQVQQVHGVPAEREGRAHEHQNNSYLYTICLPETVVEIKAIELVISRVTQGVSANASAISHCHQNKVFVNVIKGKGDTGCAWLIELKGYANRNRIERVAFFPCQSPSIATESNY